MPPRKRPEMPVPRFPACRTKQTKAVSGSFYADALARVSGGAGGSAEERTAKGVETLVQHTRKTNDLLKKQTGKISYK